MSSSQPFLPILWVRQTTVSPLNQLIFSAKNIKYVVRKQMFCLHSSARFDGHCTIEINIEILLSKRLFFQYFAIIKDKPYQKQFLILYNVTYDCRISLLKRRRNKLDEDIKENQVEKENERKREDERNLEISLRNSYIVLFIWYIKFKNIRCAYN